MKHHLASRFNTLKSCPPLPGRAGNEIRFENAPTPSDALLVAGRAGCTTRGNFVPTYPTPPIKGVGGVGGNIEQVEVPGSPATASSGDVNDPPRFTYPSGFAVELACTDYAVQFWAGEVIESRDIALDTETEMLSGHAIPRIALMTASSGDETYIIHPNDTAHFLELHAEHHWIFHNAAFDFWVLHRHLQAASGRVTPEANQTRATGLPDPLNAQSQAWLQQADLQELLWRKAAAGELHDTMYLDALVRLATHGDPVSRNLAVVAGAWAGIDDIDKDDPCRLRYGEIIGTDWRDVDFGFFRYAAKDAIATILSYHPLRDRANELATSNNIADDTVKRFGPLSETITIQGAIALAQIGRTGMCVNRTALADINAAIRNEINTLVQKMITLPGTNGLFKRDADGSLLYTKTGCPRMNTSALHCLLREVEANRQGSPIPLTDTGRLSTKTFYWRPYADASPFVQLWLLLLEKSKLLTFTQPSNGDRIRPSYQPLVRTGRTSCSGPNLQQIPRQGGLRECYVPSPGHYFLTIDYSYIELVTLAATCLHRYGHSQLAEVIKQGIDPHCYTAALVTGIELDKFMALQESHPDDFKQLRQKAKALNFGIPGGMGAASLRAYAKENYGVAMTETEAARLRNTIITDVYPELKLYLADRTIETLAKRLRCKPDDLWSAFGFGCQRPEWLPCVVRKILSGNPVKRNGQPYNQNLIDTVWAGLWLCCRDAGLKPLFLKRLAGKYLECLCCEDAVTLTGRIRGRVYYTEARNTPFQGLAADGAKRACFELVRRDYRLVAFVHDEFVIELHCDADHAKEARNIERIVCGAMAAVINHTVPVKAEFALSTCWSKSAKAVWDNQGRLLPWQPQQ